MRVSPFGNPRVNVYFQLTAAYRRLSRPSSALSAKAFTLRSFSLEQPFCFFSPFCLTEIWNKSSFYCLSFANNCILWVVRSKKTMIFRSYDFVLSASRFLLKPTKLFPLLLYGKTYTFNNKFFSITTICFVSFLYSVFNEHVVGLEDSTSDMRLPLALLELSTHLGAPFDFYEFLTTRLLMCLYLHEVASQHSFRLKPSKWVLSLVGPSGLEPPTSCLSGTRSNLLSYEPMWLVKWSCHLVFSLVRSFPLVKSEEWRVKSEEVRSFGSLVEMKGFEPLTPCLQGRCSPSWATPPWVGSLDLLRISEEGKPFLGVSIELSSRTVARKVFSPLQSLTSVFGMGTGGPSAFVTLTFP